MLKTSAVKRPNAWDKKTPQFTKRETAKVENGGQKNGN